LRILESVETVSIQQHLRAKRSGVNLDLESIPGQPGVHKSFECTLDADDVNKLILWWEFETHTIDRNCTLNALLPSAATLPRVRSFVEGDPSRCLPPLDLTAERNMEIVVVTNYVESGWLYIIDGNNRAIAQRIRTMSFKDVPDFVCAHPAMHNWAYIPMYYKREWNVR
jgi:hypothetical protein